MYGENLRLRTAVHALPQTNKYIQNALLDTIYRYSLSCEDGGNLLDLKSLDPFIIDGDLQIICKYEPNFVCGSVRNNVVTSHMHYLTLCSLYENAIAEPIKLTADMVKLKGFENLRNLIQLKNEAFLFKDVTLSCLC